MKKIDCAKYAQEILEGVKAIPKKKDLVIFYSGDNPASASYMKGKLADAEKCGVSAVKVWVANQVELVLRIQFANLAENVGGIIVQLPLPEGFDAEEALAFIDPEKDVDGFRHDSKFKPCTPEGIMYILEKEVGDLTGKTVLLIGKGKLVGKPLIDMLLDKGCTLTVAHSKTKHLDYLLMCRHHDIVITCVGKPKLVDLRYVFTEVVIDAGISRNENGKLCGDCYNFDPDDGVDMKVTTVPGGVGLLTRAMLMKHMGEASKE